MPILKEAVAIFPRFSFWSHSEHERLSQSDCFLFGTIGASSPWMGELGGKGNKKSRKCWNKVYVRVLAKNTKCWRHFYIFLETISCVLSCQFSLFALLSHLGNRCKYLHVCHHDNDSQHINDVGNETECLFSHPILFRIILLERSVMFFGNGWWIGLTRLKIDVAT